MKHNTKLPVYAVILAGGKARRMHGQDKGLVMAHGRRLIEYAIDIATPLARDIYISANRNQAEYEQLGYPVYQDRLRDYAGPLAGIMTALDMIDEDALLLVLPCDMPSLSSAIPALLQSHLLAVDADICCIRSEGRTQPLIALMHTRVHANLRRFLQKGERKVMDWVNQLNMVVVDVNGNDHSLVNINTADALTAFEQHTDT